MSSPFALRTEAALPSPGRRSRATHLNLAVLEKRVLAVGVIVVLSGVVLPPGFAAPGKSTDPGSDAAVHTPGETDAPVEAATWQFQERPAAGTAERLHPSDLSYLGAFRLPDVFNWGALGLSRHPEGDLLVTGFEALSSPDHPGEACWNPAWDCFAFYGRITIPNPVVAENWEDLPEAVLTGGMINYDQGLVSAVNRENAFVADIEFVPRTGSQTQDKVYGSVEFWYPEGDFGEDTFPTVWLANLDGSEARGMFHVGPESPPFHGRKTGSYLFTVPEWYANLYLGGRRLVTGRSRGTPAEGLPVTTHGGSQGPTLFAFHAAETDSPEGPLDAVPMLFYRVKFPGCAGPNVGDPGECDFPGFTMCDDWTGGGFVDDGSRRAVLLLGYKGLGPNCYGAEQCSNPCSDSQGYHCYPYERQVLFYDVHALGEAALGEQEPWTVLPYAVWRPNEFYLTGSPCWNAGGMTFDPGRGQLFMVERGLGGDTNAAVVHIWETNHVPHAVSIEIVPASVSVRVGDRQAFRAVGRDVGGLPVPVVEPIWQVSGGGSLSPDGSECSFTAAEVGDFTITCRDGSSGVSGTGTITIRPAVRRGPRRYLRRQPNPRSGSDPYVQDPG